MEGVLDKDNAQPWTSGITVCDRKAHTYEFLEGVQAHGLAFIVRAAGGRKPHLSYSCINGWRSLPLSPAPLRPHYPSHSPPDRPLDCSTRRLYGAKGGW
jgi:hypothetical protein